jgi:hypothetical protein
MSNLVLLKLRQATNADVPLVPRLLLVVPESVTIHIVGHGPVMPLRDLIIPPFWIVEEDRHFVLCAQHKGTGARAKLRITKKPVHHELQHQNENLDWEEGLFQTTLMIPDRAGNIAAGKA